MKNPVRARNKRRRERVRISTVNVIGWCPQNRVRWLQNRVAVLHVPANVPESSRRTDKRSGPTGWGDSAKAGECMGLGEHGYFAG